MTQKTSYRIDRDVLVPMRDGITLYADVYRPDTPERYPVLLVRTPYNKDTTALAQLYIDAMRAVRRGYVVMIQDVRGRFRSEGTFNPFFQEKDDGYDTIEWAAAQPWSTGAIGMYGGSYVGAVQWLAALAQPPHLTCIVPMLTSSDYYEGWTYQGGALQWGFMVTWIPLMLASEALFRSTDHRQDFEMRRGLVDLIDRADRAFDTLPLRDLPLMQDLAPYFHDWLAHSSRDEFWQEISIEDRYARIQVPALNLGGWYDIFQGGTLRNFSGVHQKAGSDRARQGSRLLMGPWNHSTPTTNLVGSVDYGITSSQSLSALGYDSDEDVLRFFDHWLKGVDNGVNAESPVKIFIMGIDEWRHEDAWPPSRARFTKYYLGSAGNANTAQGDGKLSSEEPSDEPVDVYLYDPRHPVPTRGGQLCCYQPALAYGAFDQRDIELRPDVLVFSTPSLEEDVEVTGPVTLVLWAATSAADTDFTGKLVDVAPDGFACNLTDGIVRARYRGGTDEARAITPGQVYQYTIDLCSTSNVFKAGHRIVLEVSSSNFPRFDRNTNTGCEPSTDTKLCPAMQSIHHDSTHPSHLVLPVVPRDDSRAEAEKEQ